MLITIIITLSIYWVIRFIIACIAEDWTLYWAVGLTLPIALVIMYLVRAWCTYTRSKEWYQKHGISRIQYILGKRVEKKR